MNVQMISSGMLLQEYRDCVMKLGQDVNDKALLRRCDQLEEEISRRMAW